MHTLNMTCLQWLCLHRAAIVSLYQKLAVLFMTNLKGTLNGVWKITKIQYNLAKWVGGHIHPSIHASMHFHNNLSSSGLQGCLSISPLSWVIDGAHPGQVVLKFTLTAISEWPINVFGLWEEATQTGASRSEPGTFLVLLCANRTNNWFFFNM